MPPQNFMTMVPAGALHSPDHVQQPLPPRPTSHVFFFHLNRPKKQSGRRSSVDKIRKRRGSVGNAFSQYGGGKRGWAYREDGMSHEGDKGVLSPYLSGGAKALEEVDTVTV